MVTTKTSLTHQKESAIRALRTLHVMPQVTNELETENLKYYSERQNKFFDGVLYWLSNKPEWEERIKELEEEYGIYIYHAVHYYAAYGEILDCLYIPPIDDEFDEEQFFDKLKAGITTIYAINFDDPDSSEFGSGAYDVKIGGLSKLS